MTIEPDADMRTELSALIGQRFRNLRTGTVVTVNDVTDNGLVWLSNGAVLPPGLFLDKWEVVDVPPR